VSGRRASIAECAAALASEAVPVTALPKSRLARVAARLARDFSAMTEADLLEAIRDFGPSDMAWLRAYSESAVKIDEEPRRGESEIALRRRIKRIRDAVAGKLTKGDRT
jgi:hypothetical protein